MKESHQNALETEAEIFCVGGMTNEIEPNLLFPHNGLLHVVGKKQSVHLPYINNNILRNPNWTVLWKSNY